MAHVGISQNLIARTQDKIKQMRVAEEKVLGEEPKLHFHSTDPYLLKIVWMEHVNLRTVIPDEWKGMTQRVPVKIKFDDGSEPFRSQLYVTTNNNMETPPNYSYYGSTERFAHASDPQLAELVEYIRKYREISQRWDKVHKQVTNFLSSCKSLNEAVKVWEDVKLYIDQDDLDRLETRREKAAKTNAASDFLATMNTDELVGAAVIARLSGAA
jgi:hypothetical protein